MYCRTCGSTMPPGAKFCSRCGALADGDRAGPIPSEETISVPAPPPPVPPAEPPPRPLTRDELAVRAAVLFVGAAAIGFGIGWLAL